MSKIRPLTSLIGQSSLQIIAIGSVLFALVGVAQALSVTSGWVRWFPNVIIPGGAESQIWLKADLWTSGNVGNAGCVEVSFSLPLSHIELAVSGWRDGAWCGDMHFFNRTATDRLCTELIYPMCTNPPFHQNFQTSVAGYVWSGSAWQGRGHQFSPSLVH